MKIYFEKVRQILLEESNLSKSQVFQKSGYGNRNRFFEFLKIWEKNEEINIQQVGNKQVINLPKQNELVDKFVRDFDTGLTNYEKVIKKHLLLLEKNKPLISSKNPFKQIKTKTPVLELDKKDNVMRPLGKMQDDHSFTWKPRKKPLFHLEVIIDLLNRLYQESSILSYGKMLPYDYRTIEKHQKQSQKLINDTIKEIEKIFFGTIDYQFVVFRIRNVMYGLVYQNQLEREIKKG